MGVGMLNFVRVISIAVAMSLTALGSAAEDSPKTSVVDYLRVIVAGDQDLADALSRNIALAGESGDGHQYWRGKTLADLYQLFEEWLHNPLKPVSNRIGIIDGGVRNNIIPDEVELVGTNQPRTNGTVCTVQTVSTVSTYAQYL